MIINSLNIYKINIPFFCEFSHALSKKSFANNVIVELVCGNGEIIGYGEGAPRSYVTGETQEMAYENINILMSQWSFPVELNDIDHLWNYIDSLPEDKRYNSSICAIEMAFLDALAKMQRKSIKEYFSSDYYTDSVCYGMVIPLGSEHLVSKSCEIIKDIGIRDIKLKMGNDPVQNLTSLKLITKAFGGDYDLKVDVNGVWSYEMGISHLSMLKEYNVKVLEQPMSPDDPEIEKYAAKAKDSGIALMADESVCSIDDMKNSRIRNSYSIVNVRLSKCGGLRRSLKLIDYLRNENILFQTGCHLGETGLLSAAGRVLNLLCRDAISHEGSYDRYLLEENIIKEDISFGPLGKAGPLNGYGLGVTVDPDTLLRLSK